MKVIYFHGYGSNSHTDKVDMLREAGFNVEAFDIDVDPRRSLPFLKTVVGEAIKDETDVVFVGTSLGAYYAAKLGDDFDVRQILINGAFCPEESLKKYDVAPDILEAYRANPIDGGLSNKEFFFGTSDEVIDNRPLIIGLLEFAPDHCHLVEGADHRFNDDFGVVIDLLNLYERELENLAT